MRATLGAGALSLLLLTACNNPVENLEVFEATLTTAEEVPVRPTGANGKAGFVWDGTTLQFSLQVDDITSVTAAHIHSGAAGVNGPVRLTLFRGTGTLPTFVDTSILSSGAAAGPDNAAITMADLLAQMRSGGAYVNVHSSAFPSGEMRGQVRLVNAD